MLLQYSTGYLPPYSVTWTFLDINQGLQMLVLYQQNRLIYWCCCQYGTLTVIQHTRGYMKNKIGTTHKRCLVKVRTTKKVEFLLPVIHGQCNTYISLWWRCVRGAAPMSTSWLGKGSSGNCPTGRRCCSNLACRVRFKYTMYVQGLYLFMLGGFSTYVHSATSLMDLT